MIPSSALRQALTSPTPQALWELRADLLERCHPTDSELIEIVGEFHAFLDRFATSTSSRDLDPPERRRLLDRLTSPLVASEESCAVKALLAGRLFQVLLLAHLTDDVAGGSPSS